MTTRERPAGGGPVRLLDLPRLWVRGGRHEFAIEQFRRDDAGHRATAVVRHRGLAIPFSPRLVWPGAGDREGWLPGEPSEKPDQRCEWTLPAGLRPDAPLRLEIWDRNRFFPLFEGPVP